MTASGFSVGVDGSKYLPYQLIMPGNKIRIGYYGDSRSNGIIPIGTVGAVTPFDVESPAIVIPGTAISTQIRSAQSKCLAELINPTFSVVANCGISGDTLSGMIGRETQAASPTRKNIADLRSKGVQLVIFRADINSISSLVTGTSYSQSIADGIWADRKDLLQRIMAAGMFIIDEPGWPWEHTDLVAFPPARQDAIRQTIAFIDAQAAAFAATTGGRIVYLSVKPLLADATYKWADYAYCIDAQGLYPPNLPANTQLVHPSITAGLILAIEEDKLAKAYFGVPHPTYLRYYPGMTGNLCPNANLTSVTAGLGTGWAAGATGTGAVATKAVTEFRGVKFQTITGSFTGPGANIVTVSAPLPVSGSGAAVQLVDGGTYGVEFKWFVDDGFGGNPTPSPINTSNLRVRLRLYYGVGGANPSVYYDEMQAITGDSCFTRAVDGHAVFPPITIPTGGGSANITAATLEFVSSRTDAATQRIGIGMPNIARIS